jgi:hypothetical protein
MKQLAFAIVIGLGGLAVTHQAHAVTCANGVYRAGCVGPNGAAAVRKPAYRAPANTVHCGSGPNRAGCVGPNGAAAVRRPY